MLADPVLDVRDAQGNSFATNDNWADTQQAEIQASGKAPPNANESAVIIVPPPGNTTAIVSGKTTLPTTPWSKPTFSHRSTASLPAEHWQAERLPCYFSRVGIL